MIERLKFMIRKKIILILLWTCILTQAQTVFAQLKMVQFEEIETLQKIEKRNIVVFIHTDWCKYCKTMQNTTFKNKELITLLNDKFYFVEFNAEVKRKIAFNGTVYNYNPNGSSSGVHELALELGTIDKQISYPTICILNDQNEIIFQHNSFMNAKEFKILLERLE
jgi:thioredoxin-related protein